MSHPSPKTFSHKQKKDPLVLYGIRPVLEALDAEPCGIRKLFVAEGKNNPNLAKILEESGKKKIEVYRVSQKDLEKKFGILYHQGVVGLVSEYQFTAVEDLVQRAFQETPAPVIVLLDGITDPGNLGGIIRSAEALKVQGIVIPKDRSAPITPVVFKRSAGSISHFPISRVTNLSQTVDYLKKEKFWIVGTDAEAKTSLWDFKFDGPVAVVFGSESTGLRRLVSEKCDFTVSIPLRGKTKSLNVSSSAAIVFYEIHRQKALAS